MTDDHLRCHVPIRWLRPALIFAASLVVFGACGRVSTDQSSHDVEDTIPTTSTATSTVIETAGQRSAVTPRSEIVTDADTQPFTTLPASIRPNELGQIPILVYHQVGAESEQFVRTPDQLRSDLQWLYANGFRAIAMREYLADEIDIPAGSRPVILTFDDSSASQFRLIPTADDRLAIDPNSAIGVLESFFDAYPEFGRSSYFAVNARNIFDWSTERDDSDQTVYASIKLQWLVDNGYEVGNHTVDHANLRELGPDDIKSQLAENDLAMQERVPGIETDVIALPYGAYPSGENATLLRGFDYQGRMFSWDATLLVGANPANSPISTEFEPYETARIQAFDDELNRWFAIFEEQPGLLYVSDGDPNTVTVPLDLHPQLVGTLDEAGLGSRRLIRY